jgi:AraC-like DNA-binding protein
LEAIFLDPLGNERIRAPREHRLSFHRLALEYPELGGEQRLRRQHLVGHPEAQADPENPWHEIARQLTIEGEPVGYLVLTACRSPSTEIAPLRSLWLRLAGQGSELPWPTLRAAWEDLPVFDQNRREAWSRNLALQGREALRLFGDARETFPSTSDRLSPLVSGVCEQVRSNYMAPLTLRELARNHGVSAEHLSRVFHENTGLRFRDYLAETRVQAARQALRESQDLISEIAGRCGFSTLSRFNRCFRELTGTTPREFRKRGVAS